MNGLYINIRIYNFSEVKSRALCWVVPLNVGMQIWIVQFQWTSLENLSVQNLFPPCQFVFGTIQNSNFIVRPILTKFQVNFVLQLLFGCQIISIVQKSIFSFDKWIFTQGLFTNYVDNILTFFDHLKPWVDIFYGINVDKKSGHLWTTYLPRLVNVVCEQPPICPLMC